MDNSIVFTVGAAAAALTTFSFIPQIIKIARTRSVNDVSFIMLAQLAAGVFLWVMYGLLRKDAIIIAANTVTFLSLIAIVCMYARYGKGAR